MNSKIFDAISDMKLIEFSYNGKYRIVEPHAYGISKAGNDVLRAFQIKGGSISDQNTGWKIFQVDDMTNINISEEIFDGPHSGYKKGDSAMVKIYTELE